jgi:Leucine Rich Repeat (LRR) protein
LTQNSFSSKIKGMAKMNKAALLVFFYAWLTLPAFAQMWSAVGQIEYRYNIDKGKVVIVGARGPGGVRGDINIPNTINGLPVVAIGGFAFYLDGNLTGVVIPNGVTDIGATAFESCSKLTHIVIPDTVTNIGFGAFSGSGLTNISIPKSVIGIGEVAFSCGRLESITVDPLNPVYSSVDGVLFNKDKTQIICCPGGKTGNFSIPDSVTDIYDYGFCD